MLKEIFGKIYEFENCTIIGENYGNKKHSFIVIDKGKNYVIGKEECVTEYPAYVAEKIAENLSNGSIEIISIAQQLG